MKNNRKQFQALSLASWEKKEKLMTQSQINQIILMTDWQF
jgi:hypothetical protein